MGHAYGGVTGCQLVFGAPIALSLTASSMVAHSVGASTRRGPLTMLTVLKGTYTLI